MRCLTLFTLYRFIHFPMLSSSKTIEKIDKNCRCRDMQDDNTQKMVYMYSFFGYEHTFSDQ